MLDLLCVVHDRRQLQRRYDFQVTWLETSFEQQDRPRPSRIARTLRLVEIEQCKTVGLRKGTCCPHQPMPIGIRFDDGPHKAAASMPPRERQIAAHRGQFDQGGYWAWHRNLERELTLNSIVPCVIGRA